MNKKEEFGRDNFYDLIPGMSLAPPLTSPLPQLLLGTELAFRVILIRKPTFRDETISWLELCQEGPNWIAMAVVPFLI